MTVDDLRRLLAEVPGDCEVWIKTRVYCDELENERAEEFKVVVAEMHDDVILLATE